MKKAKLGPISCLVCVFLSGGAAVLGQAQKPSVAAKARAVLAPHSGQIVVRGLNQPVEVLRDKWGVPHIYAKTIEDVFFGQGFAVAQDRMWQLEMWRRAGEGRQAEVLGAAYVNQDRLARLLAFRGNWDEEFRKYHPEGQKIFDAFARGINEAIQKAIDENRVPVEFEIHGFRPQAVWTAKTMLGRAAGWTLSGNVASEVSRALQIKAVGAAKVRELSPTNPEKPLAVPAGLDLEDIEPAILELAQGENAIRWKVEDLGGNNWVIDGAKSVTGKPILASDPHREVANPALQYIVHLVAPGLNVLGATEPGLPGITAGHNERVGWSFTNLGIDQQDLYVEETAPDDPNRYLHKGQWLGMEVRRQLIYVKGKPEPVEIELKFTRHGPVLYENQKRHRAFALRWVGSEPGGAGYLGSLNVMQAGNWKEFSEALAKASYLPSRSVMYADVDGAIGHAAVGLTPIRKGWDGLLPVPGKDGRYEWQGFVPFANLPSSVNTPKHFYISSNNGVLPRGVPANRPLGHEYPSDFRYDRVAEVLSANRKLALDDMARLQHDTLSLPARQMVPLLRQLKPEAPELKDAIDTLLRWDFQLDRDSAAAAIYEFWMMKLSAKAYQPRVPERARQLFSDLDIGRVIQWMRKPDAAYGANPVAARDEILLAALEEAVGELEKRLGNDMDRWRWGDLHLADFVHPLAINDENRAVFAIDPVRRGGDGHTVMNTSSPRENGFKQLAGASWMFVLDLANWDESKGLSAPGNSGQPASAHYKDLIPLWAEGDYFPLLYSRERIEKQSPDRLTLQPLRELTRAPDAAGMPHFEPVQREVFSPSGATPNAWADFDNDGDSDLFVGFRRGEMNRLYRNDGGTFTDVAVALGLADDQGTRSVAWGDYNADGHIDLYVGFGRGSGNRNQLYRNDGDGKRFTEVGHELGVDLVGESRQVSWVDFDNDGDLDLFVAFRERPNVLFRQEGGRFVDAGKQMGIDDPRKTVGAVWFDMDEDGDLDLFDANQDGDTNGFYRNEGTHFVDVAQQLGMAGTGRPLVYGSVGAAVTDFDNDGRLDLFVANYGPSFLFRNEGSGKFREVAAEMGVAIDAHAVTAAWGDYDNDGRPDLYVAAGLTTVINYRDYLFHNDGDHFSDVTPSVILKHDATQGVNSADFDRDGDLDLALTNTVPGGNHYLFRNLLPPERTGRSIQIMVLDQHGRYTKAGAEIRVYTVGKRQLLGTRLVDTSSGYCSQNVMPVHVGLGSEEGPVVVEVTFLTKAGRTVTRVSGVDPTTLRGRPLVVKAGTGTGESR